MKPEQLVALKAAIATQTDPEFVALREKGHTGAMAEWLGDRAVGQRLGKTVTVEQISTLSIKAAVANAHGFKGITPEEIARLQWLTTGDTFPMGDAGMRAAVAAVLEPHADALQAFQALATRPASVAEEAVGVPWISNEEVVAAVNFKAVAEGEAEIEVAK